MATEKRKPPGRKLRARFARNRIERKFLEHEIQELKDDMAEAKTVKAAMKIALEIERKKAKRDSLPVRRRPQNGSNRGRGSTFGGLFS